MSEPQNIQKAYPSHYDIDSILVPKYGRPTNTVPVILMRLTTDLNGNIFNAHGQGDGYVTTDWDNANHLCRFHQAPADVRELAGLALKKKISGSVQVYRYFRSSNNDYCVSTKTAMNGWQRQESLGYWMTSEKNVTVEIGTQSRSCKTTPVYQYYKASINRHNVSLQNMDDGWDGWSKSIVGYVVAYSEIVQ